MPTDDGPADDLGLERRLKAVMSAVEPQSRETIDRQVARAMAEFTRASNTSRPVPGVARAALVAAVLCLFAAGGWWARGETANSPVAAEADIRPVRGLISPCPSVAGVYLGRTNLGGVDVAIYVDLRGTDVSVRFVDPALCTESAVLPSPSPGR